MELSLPLEQDILYEIVSAIAWFDGTWMPAYSSSDGAGSKAVMILHVSTCMLGDAARISPHMHSACCSALQVRHAASDTR